MTRHDISPERIEETMRWRHHLHAHPELAFEERQTAAFIAGRLAEWGIAVKDGYGGTGLVGTLRRGTSNRSIAIRADMDALPIIETSGAAYASKTTGKMHACGHDGHVAMLLAAARQASEMDFDGTVHFIFQPAEEAEGGARVMVADGLFRDFPADAVYALHNWPALDVGSVVARDDAMMAAFGVFEITITGRGAHGAMPHEGADPLVASAQIVTALQTIASRNVSPLEAAVVSVTQIHGGDAWNVIPEKAVIRGTTRWFDKAVGDTLENRMRTLVSALAEGLGCTAELDYQRRYPATINDPAAAALARSVAAADPALTVIDAPPSMAAEDFAFMLDERPGCYLWLGARRDGANPGLHSPHYDFNDAIIGQGVNLWTRLIATSLGR
ncbi:MULTISPECIES: M20 aminoacylase family protein [unclassified Ensifer]|uniref:M20 aminoacylase family protein n=1 Tax=unclassified Ensifer TaxID=2633371 RepID=UPI00071512B6|nr:MULTISPECIES: M20 aminoacylase family protein [unclassified Ensifer]KQX42254.1 peptidase M20 [Ensifer sp. Root1298]KQX72065.1 peptidase M20 [Ensifer sp. Root1312]KRC15444.1 peptidase M20 [Ensifer sp. Root74]KRD78838.1 peptidase M20 [Ensifer sp. Root954]